MGICASSDLTTRIPDRNINFSPSAKVVDLDGRLLEFRRLITAAEVLSVHPNCFLCCADTLLIDSNAPQLPGHHVLQIGHIYFLMPLSKSLTPLSLQDLCALAIKAIKALNSNSAQFLHEYRGLGFPG